MSKALTVQEVQERLNKTFEQNVILIGEYKNRRTPIKLKCLDCNNEWEALPSSVIYNDYLHKCPNCGFKKGKTVKCAYCGKEIYRTPYQLQRSETGYYYCSHTCGNLHKNQLRKEAGEWEQGKTTYRVRALNFYPKECAICGYKEDERILQIHHRDKNRENNDISNLVVLCPTCHWKITLDLYTLTKDNQLIENII